MKTLMLNLFFLISLINPDFDNPSLNEITYSGDLILTKLDQIETLICKKTGVEFDQHENSFVLNGYFVHTKANVRKYAHSVYEELFYQVENPENICKMRLVKNLNGDRELAVMIKNNDEIINYHAVFDSQGNLLEEDPWGNEQGYTAETIDLYDQYQIIFSQQVNGINYASK